MDTDTSHHHKTAFELPFWSQQHPQSAEAQRHTRDWARSFDLIHSEYALSRFDALGYGRLMAYACPSASLDDLLLIVDWNTLFFVFDDVQGNAVATSRITEYEALRQSAWQVIRDRGAGSAPGNPVTAALSDLCRRTFPGRSAAWSRRFTLNLELWLSGHARENAYRSAGTTPDPEQYVQLRRDASTVFPTVDLMEVAEGVDIPERLYFGRHYQTLVTGTADIMCWINDIHSLPAETASDDPINLVTVLSRHRGLPPAEAVGTVVRMVHLRVAEHQAAQRALDAELALAGDGPSPDGSPAGAPVPGEPPAKAPPAGELSPDTAAGILRVIRDQGSWAAGMEIWDRTDTIRHRITEISEADRLPRYAEDLLTH